MCVLQTCAKQRVAATTVKPPPEGTLATANSSYDGSLDQGRQSAVNAMQRGRNNQGMSSTRPDVDASIFIIYIYVCM